MKTTQDNAVLEVRIKPAKKNSGKTKSASKEKLVVVEGLEADMPKSIFQGRNWNKDLK